MFAKKIIRVDLLGSKSNFAIPNPPYKVEEKKISKILKKITKMDKYSKTNGEGPVSI